MYDYKKEFKRIGQQVNDDIEALITEYTKIYNLYRQEHKELIDLKKKYGLIDIEQKQD
jgi:hypothetical protein